MSYNPFEAPQSDSRAIGVLKQNGIKVGLLGADMKSI